MQRYRKKWPIISKTNQSIGTHLKILEFTEKKVQIIICLELQRKIIITNEFLENISWEENYIKNLKLQKLKKNTRSRMNNSRNGLSRRKDQRLQRQIINYSNKNKQPKDKARETVICETIWSILTCVQLKMDDQLSALQIKINWLKMKTKWRDFHINRS